MGSWLELLEGSMREGEGDRGRERQTDRFEVAGRLELQSQLAVVAHTGIRRFSSQISGTRDGSATGSPRPKSNHCGPTRLLDLLTLP